VLEHRLHDRGDLTLDGLDELGPIHVCAVMKQNSSVAQKKRAKNK